MNEKHAARADITAKIRETAAAFDSAAEIADAAAVTAETARRSAARAESAAVDAIISGVAEMWQIVRDYRAITANLSAAIECNISMTNATDYCVSEITDEILDFVTNARESVQTVIEDLENRRESIRESGAAFFAEIAYAARFISEWDYYEMQLSECASAVWAAIESHSLFDGNGGDMYADGEFWDICRETRRALSAFEDICNSPISAANALQEIIDFLSE